MFNASAVLPIAGRAAKIIRFDFTKPPVALSKFINPVVTPCKPLFSALLCNSSKACTIISSIELSVTDDFDFANDDNFCSAVANTRSASCCSDSASDVNSRPICASCLKRDFSFICLQYHFIRAVVYSNSINPLKYDGFILSGICPLSVSSLFTTSAFIGTPLLYKLIIASYISLCSVR